MSSDIWNPWHGCRKYSEGCDHCYMYYLDNERGKSGGEIYKVKTNSDLSSSVYHTKCKKRICTPPAGGKSQFGGNSSSANSASVSSFSFSMTCFVDKPQPGAGVVEHHQGQFLVVKVHVQPSLSGRRWGCTPGHRTFP